MSESAAATVSLMIPLDHYRVVAGVGHWFLKTSFCFFFFFLFLLFFFFPKLYFVKEIIYPSISSVIKS